MALFRRRSKETSDLNQPRVEPRWSHRLGHLGDAIDGTDQDIRDLAIILEGGPGDRGAMLSLLGHRQSVFHSGWASMMFRLESGADDLTSHATGLSAQSHAQAISPAVSAGPWNARLSAIGALIDERRPELLSPTLVFLPGGVVINGVLSSPFAPQRSSLISFELSNDEIRAVAMAAMPAGQPSSMPARQS